MHSPGSWRDASLGAVLAGIDAGWSPACIEQAPSTGQWGILKVSAVTSGRFKREEAKTLPDALSPRVEIAVKRGDVVMARANGVAALVGMTVQVREDAERLMLSDKLLRLNPNPERVTHDYLASLMSSSNVRAQLDRVLSGSSGQRNISQAHVRALRVQVPPLPEQARIAEILDALDEVIRKTEQLIAKLKQVKQGLLHDLLTRGIDDNGELRDPDSHPEQFKDYPLGRIPGHWQVAALRTAADISSGTTPERAQARYWSGGTVPWVKTSEVNFTNITETEEAVTELALTETALRLYQPGTVLVAMYGQGATRGRSAMLSVSATTNQACAAIQPHAGKLTPLFLFSYLKAQYEQLRSLGHGSNQTNLSASLLGESALVLPPMHEQLAIVAILETHDCRTQLEEREVRKLSVLKRGLVEDLLTGRHRVTKPETTNRACPGGSCAVDSLQPSYGVTGRS